MRSRAAFWNFVLFQCAKNHGCMEKKVKVVKQTHTTHSPACSVGGFCGFRVTLRFCWGFLFFFFFFYWQVYGRFSMTWEYWCRAGASLRFLSKIQCAVDTQWSASNLWLNTPLWTGDCVSPGCGSSCMVPGHAVMQKSARICKNRF